MKVSEIREKETSHLRHELVEKQKHLFDLRTQGVTEKLADPSQLGKTRKDIARMKTVLRERELAEQKQTGGQAGQGQAGQESGQGEGQS